MNAATERRDSPGVAPKGTPQKSIPDLESEMAGNVGSGLDDGENGLDRVST